MAIVRRFCLLGFSLVATLVSYAQTGLPTLSQPLQPQVLNRGPVQLDLRTYFGVPGVTGQVVQFSTTLGRVNVELRAAEAPRLVANFLSYVTKNAYDNTLIHRVSNLGAIVPAIVQGGGYLATPIPPLPPSIPRSSPVAAEVRLPNTRGTLAAVRDSNDPNSATSEFLFNTIDNTATLGPTSGGGYSVFGRVLGTGMSVVDAISQIPTVNLVGTFLNEIPLRAFTATQTTITSANYISVNTVRVIPIYPPASGDPTAVLSFVATPANPGIVAVSMTGATLTLTPLSVGTVNVTVRAVDANGNSSVASTFAVTVPAGALLPPLFVTQPVSQTVASGTTVVFNAMATGGESGIFPLRYQWLWNGAPFPSPDSPMLVLRSASTDAAGTYTCLATNAAGATLSTEATLSVVSAKAFDVGRLVNLAIRTNAGNLDETLIVGFAIGGNDTTGTKPLLIRGVGPSLTQFGLNEVLLDPVLTLFQGRTTVAENDNWLGNEAIATRGTQVGAFPLAAPSALDAAFANAQPSGSYTVQIRDRVSRTGMALVEIYDATVPEAINETTPRLVNASARAQVKANNLLIAGFVVGGNLPVTVLIRAIGPTLSSFGVTNALADPRLQLFTGTTFVRENDDWDGDSQLATIASSVGAFTLSGPTSKDAVILATLKPGSYTAQVRGTGIVRTETDEEGKVTVLEDGGVALIEVYEIR